MCSKKVEHNARIVSQVIVIIQSLVVVYEDDRHYREIDKEPLKMDNAVLTT